MSGLIRIMLVEDNQDDYEATVRSLKKNDFMNPVQWCRTGKEALEVLYAPVLCADGSSQKKPDLILLDLNMPGIDGRQVLHTIKNDIALKSIPVVILTTSADAKDIAQCYQSGASTYIQKPVSFDGLTQAIGTMKEYWFGVALLPQQEMQAP